VPSAMQPWKQLALFLPEQHLSFMTYWGVHTDGSLITTCLCMHLPSLWGSDQHTDWRGLLQSSLHLPSLWGSDQHTNWRGSSQSACYRRASLWWWSYKCMDAEEAAWFMRDRHQSNNL
jgi:hypothetical protein